MSTPPAQTSPPLFEIERGMTYVWICQHGVKGRPLLLHAHAVTQEVKAVDGTHQARAGAAEKNARCQAIFFGIQCQLLSALLDGVKNLQTFTQITLRAMTDRGLRKIGEIGLKTFHLGFIHRTTLLQLLFKATLVLRFYTVGCHGTGKRMLKVGYGRSAQTLSVDAGSWRAE